MKYWEVIADSLSKAGWSWGWVSAIDSDGRTIWIADAHRGNGKRFVVQADEKLTAFVELLPANQFREDKNAWQFTIPEERAIHMSRELRTRNKERVI
jgi:hypothetical protein